MYALQDSVIEENDSVNIEYAVTSDMVTLSLIAMFSVIGGDYRKT